MLGAVLAAISPAASSIGFIRQCTSALAARNEATTTARTAVIERRDDDDPSSSDISTGTSFEAT